MVDKMIEAQMGSLKGTSAPSGPKWEEPTPRSSEEDKVKSEQPEELMPMNEARTLQLGGGLPTAMRRHWKVLSAAGLVLLFVFAVLYAGSGHSASSTSTSEAGAAPGGIASNLSSSTESSASPEARSEAGSVSAEGRARPEARSKAGSASAESSFERPVKGSGKDIPLAAVNSTSGSGDPEAGATNLSTDNSSVEALASYKLACPALLKLEGGCAHDLSLEDKTLPSATLVEHACPEQCKATLERYQHACPALLKLDGGCDHDLSLDDNSLPAHTLVRSMCSVECSSVAVATSTTSAASAAPSTAALTPPAAKRPIARTEAVQQELPSKPVRPSKWVAYCLAVVTALGWIALCLRVHEVLPSVQGLPLPA
eukprot:TRINITY_DN35873_c0_g1_i3.p1 TRINITY_DN35873_c0_g1~~TRINITY_DN35873_c0_g1_i3.p1  ORF type:complete len:370 (+),score=73.83 TRINITY_DN35873_c0_g1_i3:72-1181(+)